jgi:hypothetical protein
MRTTRAIEPREVWRPHRRRRSALDEGLRGQTFGAASACRVLDAAEREKIAREMQAAGRWLQAQRKIRQPGGS